MSLSSEVVLTQATNQWSSRPADERFKSLEELHAKAQAFRDAAIESPGVPLQSLRVQAADGDVKVIGATGALANLTHWSFGQLARLADAPPAYLRKLPATLAAQNLNHGLANADIDGDTKILFHGDPAAKQLDSFRASLTARAFTGDGYARIWNSDITSRLIRLTQQSPEWQPAPAAFDGSRGLYLSDHDVFAFLVDNERRIFEKDPNGGLGRGFFVANSEVGDKAFWILKFLYEWVCGNHRVVGATQLQEIRIRHVGEASDRAFGQLEVELKKYAEASASDDEAKIVSAKSHILGADKDEVLDTVFDLNIPKLSRKLLDESYDLAEKRENWYGNPRSAWGLTGGITEIARDLPHGDDRVALDRAAGKILQIAF